ncbi:outer membrane protein assembly factor BamB family protein, partial [Agromyces zhanjiangensis]|uniref:outer membrane protein assembly factor BamB family protein n=1 Tax=Agromyces zhanjiangensis TaxID=3158562 RepID=UPI0033996F38
SVAAGKSAVAAGTSTGVVVAFDAATGLLLWASDLTGGAGSPVEVSGVAFGKDVVVAGTSTGEVTAMDGATGALWWVTDVGSGSAALGVAAEKSRAYAAIAGGALVAVD